MSEYNSSDANSSEVTLNPSSFDLKSITIPLIACGFSEFTILEIIGGKRNTHRSRRTRRRHASKSEEMEIEGLQEEEWDDIPEHVDIPSAGASKTRAAATCAI